MQQGLHTALVSPDDWTWHLKFRIPGSLNFTFSKQTTDSSLKALWSYQRPCKLLFFFFSSPLTPPQPSGLTCRRDLLYLHHPCPPPVWAAIPLWTQGGHHCSRILTTNCPFSPTKLSFLGFTLLHKTRAHRTRAHSLPWTGAGRGARGN